MRDILYNLVAATGDALGFGPVSMAGDQLGKLLWLALPKRRAIATKAVAEHLNLPYGEARRIARSSFSNSCRSFLELLLARRADWHFMTERLQYADPQNLAAVCADPEPAVLATAHLGAWELLAGAQQLVLDRPAKGIVIRNTKDEAMNRLIFRLRTRPGVRIIEHRNASGPTLEILRQRGAVAFLVDHNCRRDEAVFLPFLGETAAVNMGPALLAVRAKAAIWPAFHDAFAGRALLSACWRTTAYVLTQRQHPRSRTPGSGILYAGCGKAGPGNPGAMVLDAPTLKTRPEQEND